MAGLPGLDKYAEKNSLRPNPRTANPEIGELLSRGQETILVGHFGSWDSSATVTNGLTKPGQKAGALGLHDEFTKPPKNIRRPLY